MNLNEYANPAKRLLRFVEQVSHKPDQVSTVQVWADALGLDPQIANNDPHQVLIKLKLLREEVDLVEKLMAETPFSAQLYAPYLDRVRRTISVPNSSAGWSNYKQNLQADTLLALRYCSEILPPEPELAMEDLQSVLDKVSELRLEIESLTLSRGVRDFLLRQLDIIENGIHDYPIKGGSAIKNAFKEGFADFASNAYSLEKEADKAEASKVARVWGALQIAGKGFVETDRIATAYVHLIEKGQNASQALIGWFNSYEPA